MRVTGAFWIVYCIIFFFFIVKVKRGSWVEEKESYTVSREKVISATRRNTDLHYGYVRFLDKNHSLNIVIFHNPGYITFISDSRGGESYSELVSYHVLKE